MKRLILAVLGIVAATMMGSAQSYEFVLSDFPMFNGLNISNDFEVTVYPSEKYSVKFIIEEPYKDYVSANVKGSVLNISLDTKNIPSEVKKAYKGKYAAAFKVAVSMPLNEMSVIELSDKAVLRFAGEIVTKKMDISLTDNALLDGITITSRNATIATDKKSSALVSIATDKLSVAVNSSSSLNLTQTTNKADINIAGTSNLTMHGSSDMLDFNAKGGAKASVTGSAASVKFVTSGAVNVDALNLACDNAEVTMSGYGNLTESASKHLKVTLSGGATLIYNNAPVLEVENIKSSSMAKYSSR